MMISVFTLYSLPLIILIFLLLLLVLLPVYFFFRVTKQPDVHPIFAGRDALDEAEFYERFLPDSEAPMFVLIPVRQILEEELGADLSCLAPDDDFGTTFERFFDGDDNFDIYEAKMRIEEEFGIKISDQEAKEASNIVLLVELVWRKLKQFK